MTEASTALLAEYSKTAIIRAEVKAFRGRFGEVPNIKDKEEGSLYNFYFG